MIYATILYKDTLRLCAVDKRAEKVFLLDEYFKNSNMVSPYDMTAFIEIYTYSMGKEVRNFMKENGKAGIPFSEISFKAPLLEPKRNIVCLGKNYADHAKEIAVQIKTESKDSSLPEYPIYFTKANHTCIGQGETILKHENATKKIDYEVELALIIGKTGINIKKEEAFQYLFGYTIANDISARDLQRMHNNWFKGKSLTTHCPMGPWIVTKDEIEFPPRLDIKSYINGELRQNSNTDQLIFDIPFIISDLSKGFELRPGDVILTGTPAGVGMGFVPHKYLNSGDEIRCEIQNIGTLINKIEA